MSELDDPFSGLVSVVNRPGLGGLLQRVADAHASTAIILRAHGGRDAARRAEQSASRIRLTLEHPRSVERMRGFANALVGCVHTQTLLERALEGALCLMGTDLGNIQIRDPISGILTIAAESGFSDEFLEYFAEVDDQSSACGRSAIQRQQTVIADVNDDAAFAPHREIAAAAGFQAVQSTPLLDPGGRVRGVVSTHDRAAHRPSGAELQILAWYGEHVAAALADGHRVRRTLYSTYSLNAMLHEQTAERHESAARLMRQSADLRSRSGASQQEAVVTLDWARRALDCAKSERARTRALVQRATEIRHNGHADALPVRLMR
jgi:GAF domain-containing protein